MTSDLLPVHGFVLAGGKSSRMGRDKALVEFRGVPLVEIALAKLRTFCSAVSISGNRVDLAEFAPVVHEMRTDAGPAAGVEAGMEVCSQEWALFIPVDVPMVPAEFLRLWVEEAIRKKMTVSYLGVQRSQPAFCLLQCDRRKTFSILLDGGERKLEPLLNRTAAADGYASWMYDERDLYGYPHYNGPDHDTLDLWFQNINTPQGLAEAEKAVSK